MRVALICLLLAVAAAPAFGTEGKPFEAVPDAQKGLYRFDLKKMYADDDAWQRDYAAVKSLIWETQEESEKGVTTPAGLLAVMRAREKAEDLLVKLWAYGEFRQATDTDDVQPLEKYLKLRADFDSKTAFVQVELKGLDEKKVDELVRQEPALAKYRFFIDDAVRKGPHTLSEPQENILAKLGPDLNSWQVDLFQKVFDRTAFPTVEVGCKNLDVYREFDSLMQNPDRSVRERAFKGTYETFGKIQDLVGFALLREIRTLNDQARMRKYDTYFDQTLFERYLSTSQVDAMFGQIERRAYLYQAYQRYRMDQAKANLGVDPVEIWDMDVPSKGAELPRFTADEGIRLVEQSLQVLGPEYSKELADLLDPKNGRIDIVGGPKRKQGAFTEGYWGYFMDNYQGLLDNVGTLAHEAGHAVHHKLVFNHQGSDWLSQGPSYMTESFATFNEWLVRDRLIRTEKNPAVVKALKEDAVDRMMSLWELARRARFEEVCYHRVAERQIVDEKGFDQACMDTGKMYDLFFTRNPDLMQVHWIRKHHYWSVPTYYVNYVLAQVLALSYYQRYLEDPKGFSKKYVDMVEAGFQKPPAQMLKEYLDIDLGSSKTLDRTLAMIETSFTDLKGGPVPAGKGK